MRDYLRLTFTIIVMRLKLSEARFDLKRIDYHNLDSLDNLKAEDMGDLHNSLMMNVEEKLFDNPIQTRESYQQLIYDEVILLCDDLDSKCKELVLKEITQSTYITKEIFTAGNSYNIQAIFPEFLDKDLKDSFTKIYDAILLIDNDDVEKSQKKIRIVADETKKSDMTQLNKNVIATVASIAKGSIEFWTSLQKNPENMFHRTLRGFYGRRLKSLDDDFSNQTTELHESANATGLNETANSSITMRPIQVAIQDAREEFRPFKFVACDVIGSIRSSITTVFSLFFLWATPFNLFSALTQGAAISSLATVGMYIPGFFEVSNCIVASNVNFTNATQQISNITGYGLAHNAWEWWYPSCNATELFGDVLGKYLASRFPGAFEFSGISAIKSEKIP